LQLTDLMTIYTNYIFLVIVLLAYFFLKVIIGLLFVNLFEEKI